MTKSLQLECHREASVLIISLRGRLDGNSSREFDKFVTEELGKEDGDIVLEATNLVFLSSAGLRELMLLAKRLGKQGRKASIVGAGSIIKETLAMTGIDSLFHFNDNLEEGKKAAMSGRRKGGRFLESWFNRLS